MNSRIRIRPDRKDTWHLTQFMLKDGLAGFEYSWSTESFHWQDLTKRPSRSIICRAQNPSDAPFRFQAFTIYDKNDPVTKSVVVNP